MSSTEGEAVRGSGEPEAVRNRLLRRVDWRVLLSNPAPDRVVCFAGGDLARAVELIAQTVVKPTKAAGDCDLAVVQDPDGEVLAAAAAALRPGGSLYAEWSSPRRGWYGRARRDVEASGFGEVFVYWPWPPVFRRSPTFWVPLDAPGAQAYFLQSRSRSASPLRRLLYALRRGAWRAAVRIGYAFPVCIAATRAGGASPPSAPAIIAADSPPKGRRSLLLFTGGPRSVSKIVGFAFDEPGSTPRFVVKLPRTPESAELLRHEAHVLQALAARAPQVRGVPRLEFMHDRRGILVVAETFVGGTPLFELIRPDRYRTLALEATDWLIGLRLGREVVAREAWRDRLVRPIVDDFREQFGAVVDPDVLQAAERVIGTLPVSLPLVCEHRDYAAWNILVQPSGQLGVLDWEGAELEGLPGLDLLYFLAYQGFFLDGALRSGRYRESLRSCVDANTSSGRVTNECLALYSSSLGLPESCWPALRVLVWMLKARSEYARFVEDSRGRPPAETLRSSLFVSLWRDEVGRLG